MAEKVKKLFYNEVSRLIDGLFMTLKEKGFKYQLVKDFVDGYLVNDGYATASGENRIAAIICDYAAAKNMALEELATRYKIHQEVQEIGKKNGYRLA